MESNDFAYRLKLFISTLKMNSSQFADRVGIARPSLSQILSRRNKKVSNNVVTLIHDAFPALSIMWLLFGEGEMCGDSSGAVLSTETVVPESENGENTPFHASEESAPPYPAIIDPLSDPSGFTPNYEEDPLTASSGTQTSEEMAVREKMTNFETRREFQPGEKSTNPSESKNNPILRGLTDCENQASTRINTMTAADLKILDLTRQIDKMRENPRRVTQITIYYDDSTFETFIPK